MQLTLRLESVECASPIRVGVVSSAGRASPLQGEGHRFDPCTTHQLDILVKANECCDMML